MVISGREIQFCKQIRFDSTSSLAAVEIILKFTIKRNLVAAMKHYYLIFMLNFNEKKQNNNPLLLLCSVVK